MNRTILRTSAFLTIFLFYNNLFAQSELSKQLYLGVGISHESVKDKIFSGLNFQGLVYNANLGYEKENDNIFWSTYAIAKYGNVDYQNLYFKSDFIDLELNFAFAKKLEKSLLKNYYLGSFLKAGMNILDFDGYENGSWTSGYSLGILLRRSYKFTNNHRLIAAFSYPLINLMSRPSYTGRDDFVFSNTDKVPKIIFTRNKLYTINKVVNPNLNFRYEINLSKLNLFAIANYEYLYVDTIKEINSSSLSIFVGCTKYLE